MRKVVALAFILGVCLTPIASDAAPALSYEVGEIVIERAGSLDPLPSEPCSSQASTAEDAGTCTTAPGCLVAADPLTGAAFPDDPPCSLAITFVLSGSVPGASGSVALEMLGEISSTSGAVLAENVNILYGGPFEVPVAADGTFSAVVVASGWRTWGAGPTCSHFSLYWVKVHDPSIPLGVAPEDPGPGADVDRCV